MNVIWSERADQDILSIENHLLSTNLTEQKVDQIIDGLTSATDRLEHWPYSGRMIPELNNPDFREIIHKSWRIMYFVSPDGGVEIQNVIHTAQQFGELGK